MPGKNNRRGAAAYLLIAITTIIAWFPSLFIRLINDDFQIILWIVPDSLAECFRPLWSPHVVDVYWRPLAAMVNTFTIFFFGPDPFVFHLVSLAAYTIAALLLFRFMKLLNLSTEASLLFTLLFSLLPSHEMAVAWLSTRNDIFSLIFILLALSFFIKRMGLPELPTVPAGAFTVKEGVAAGPGGRLTGSGFFIVLTVLMLIAFLNKEAAYPLVLMFPFYRLVYCGEPVGRLKVYREFIAGSALILSIVFLRWLFIGGGFLFQSQNVSTVSFGDMVFNFAAYLPLSFIPSDLLEHLYLFAKANVAVFSMICAAALTGAVLLFRRTRIINRKAALFGLFWFLAFIVPVLFKLGRWYTFIPSAGLVITLAAFYDSVNHKNLRRVAILFLIAVSGYSGFERMNDWAGVSEKSEKAFLSLRSIDCKDMDHITLLAAPNKTDNVNSMCVGVQQLVNYHTGHSSADVAYPLKTETFGDCRISMDRPADRCFIFRATNCRFLIPGSKSASYLTDEERSYADSSIAINVINHSDGRSVARVRLLKPPPGPAAIIYYDGTVFRKIDASGANEDQ